MDFLFLESRCSKYHTTYREPTLTMVLSMFTTLLCINLKNGCKEELDDEKNWKIMKSIASIKLFNVLLSHAPNLSSSKMFKIIWMKLTNV